LPSSPLRVGHHDRLVEFLRALRDIRRLAEDLLAQLALLAEAPLAQSVELRRLALLLGGRAAVVVLAIERDRTSATSAVVLMQLFLSAGDEPSRTRHATPANGGGGIMFEVVVGHHVVLSPFRLPTGRGPSSPASVRVMNPINPAAEVKRSAVPEAMCSARPTKSSPAGSVSARSCTTNARAAGSGAPAGFALRSWSPCAP
jgi:hypothetical protein